MEATAREALKRLSYIEGHLAGIRRMVDQDQPCVGIVRQTNAVRRAIQKMEVLLLRAHLNTCVCPAVRDGRGGQGMRELVQLYGMLGRRREPDGNATRNA